MGQGRTWYCYCITYQLLECFLLCCKLIPTMRLNPITLLLLILTTGSLSARPLVIVTDIEPVRAIVAAVTADLQTAEALIPPTVSAHDFALKPSDAIRLRAADLFVWLGPGATPGLARIALDPALADHALPLGEVAGTRHLPARRAGVFSAGTDNGEADPHAWLDPENATLWASAIADALTGLDPENALHYQQNADAFTKDVATARAKVTALLGTGPHRPFVQFHDSFQYFETAFGLTALGAATSEDEETTSLGILSDLRTALSESGQSCVIAATNEQAHRARALLDLPQTSLGQVDAMGRDLPGGNWRYTDFMEKIASGFAACLKP